MVSGSESPNDPLNPQYDGCFVRQNVPCRPNNPIKILYKLPIINYTHIIHRTSPGMFVSAPPAALAIPKAPTMVSTIRRLMALVVPSGEAVSKSQVT